MGDLFHLINQKNRGSMPRRAAVAWKNFSYAPMLGGELRGQRAARRKRLIREEIELTGFGDRCRRGGRFLRIWENGRDGEQICSGVTNKDGGADSRGFGRACVP